MDEKALTPAEYYQRAYDRNIAIGNAWLKAQPKPVYDPRISYTFDFDPMSSYDWKEATEDGGDIFVRQHDEAIAKFTKYSHIKIG